MNRSVVQLGQQLLGIWKQLGVNQRINLALAAGVVVAGLIGLAYWSVRVDYGLLYGRLDEGEVGKVVGYLEEAKIPYQLGEAGSVLVPTDKVHKTRLQLSERNIPSGGVQGYELLDKVNWGISDRQQNENIRRALEGELARTIGHLDNVARASVRIALPENRWLGSAADKAKASVTLRTRGPLGGSTAEAIRFMVANSVSGLLPSQVFVMDQRGSILSENSEPDSLAGPINDQFRIKMRVEQNMAQRVQDALEKIVGFGNSVVLVSADINTDQKTITETKYDPDGQVIRSTTTTEEKSDNKTPSSGGVAGIAANLGTDTNSVANGGNGQNSTSKIIKNNIYEINQIANTLIQSPGGIKRISAAVTVAKQYEGTGADRKAVPRTAEQLQNLKRWIQDALGIQISADGISRDSITLVEETMGDPFVDAARDTGREQTKQFWWQQIQNFIYPALALGVLLVFWRMVKSTSAESLPASVKVSGDGEEGDGQSMTATGGFRPEWGRSQPMVLTPDMLNKLVQENPENFTQAIQSWLGRDARPES